MNHDIALNTTVICLHGRALLGSVAPHDMSETGSQDPRASTPHLPPASNIGGHSVKSGELLEASEVLESRAGETPVMSSHDASKALEEDLAHRQRILEAALQPKPFAVLLGASNMPHDCSIWGPDWRQRLPEGHPERVKAERADNLRKAGSLAAHRTIKSAHRALLASARRTNNAGPH